MTSNGNLYQLDVTGNSNKKISNFAVTITTLVRFIKEKNSGDIASCTAVNKNDYLGNIILYNANKFNQTTNLVVYAI